MKKLFKTCVIIMALVTFFVILISCNNQQKTYSVIFYVDNQEFLTFNYEENQNIDFPSPPEEQNRQFNFWGYKLNDKIYKISPSKLIDYADENNVIKLFAVYITDEDIFPDKPVQKIEITLINTLENTHIILNYTSGIYFSPPDLSDTDKYEFNGWYYDFEYQNQYIEQNIIQDITLYSMFSVKIQHNFSEWITVKEPTCFESGKKERSCKDKNCSKSEVEILEKLTHIYNLTIEKVTCENQGCERYICALCNFEYLDNIIKPNGHNFGDYVVTKNPTCIEDGEESTICSDCNQTKTKIVEKIPHNYNVETINPDCLNDGYKNYECKTCDDSYSEKDKDKLGHKMSNEKVEIEPSCIKEGLAIISCEHCAHKEEKVLTPNGHRFSETIVLSTCEEQGYTIHSCYNCTENYQENYVEKLDHLYNSIGEIVKPATCEKVGEILYHCKRADCSHTKSEVLPKMNHFYIESITSPTCSSVGFSKFECSECKDSFIAKETPKLDHEYTLEIIQPTCTEKGYTCYKCKFCAHAYSGNYTEIIDHTFIINKVPALCENEGYTIKVCEYCNLSLKEDIISALNHSIYNVEIESTCVNEGSIKEYCHNCDYSHLLEELPLLEHTMSEWLEVEDKLVSNCINCDYIEEKLNEKVKINYEYDYLKDCYNVIGASDNNITYLEIPSLYQGKKVSKINPNAFKNFNNLAYVYINPNLTKISENAFANCINLRIAYLPYTIKNNSTFSVHEQAFSNCPNITFLSENYTSLAYPEPLWYSQVFKNYLNSEYFGNIYQDISDSNYFYENGFHYIIKNQTASVIKYSGKDKDIVFKDFIEFNNKKISITEIGEYAFINSEVRSVKFNMSLKIIRINAFKSSHNLEKIYIDNNVTTVYKFAFKNCPKLTIYLNQPEIPKGFNIYWKDSSTEIVFTTN